MSRTAGSYRWTNVLYRYIFESGRCARENSLPYDRLSRLRFGCSIFRMIMIVQFVHWYLTIYSNIATYLYSINSFTIDVKVLRKISKYVFRFAFFFFFLSPLSVRFRVRRQERSVSREIEWIENSSQEIHTPCGDLLDRTVFHR